MNSRHRSEEGQYTNDIYDEQSNDKKFDYLHQKVALLKKVNHFLSRHLK